MASIDFADATVDRMERGVARAIANGSYQSTERYDLGDGRELRVTAVRQPDKIIMTWSLWIDGGYSDTTRTAAAAKIARHAAHAGVA